MSEARTTTLRVTIRGNRRPQRLGDEPIWDRLKPMPALTGGATSPAGGGAHS